jgi:hypothetical protein
MFSSILKNTVTLLKKVKSKLRNIRKICVGKEKNYASPSWKIRASSMKLEWTKE